MQEFDARRAALELVTAFVNNNSLKASELPGLLSDVFGAIAGFDQTGDTALPANEIVSVQGTIVPAETEAATTLPVTETKSPLPKVSIKESLSDPNHILSMITGEKLKTLKRHLAHHGLTDVQYRERYGLPDDYPMVAPAYSELRRSVAKKMGLGRAKKPEPDKAGQAGKGGQSAKPAAAKPTKRKASSGGTAPVKPTKAVSMDSGSSPKRRSVKSKKPSSAETKKDTASAVSPEVTSAPASPATQVAAEMPKPRAGRKVKASSAGKAPKAKAVAPSAKVSSTTGKAPASGDTPKADASMTDSPAGTDSGRTESSEPKTSKRRRLAPAFSG